MLLPVDSNGLQCAQYMLSENHPTRMQTALDRGPKLPASCKLQETCWVGKVRVLHILDASASLVEGCHTLQHSQLGYSWYSKALVLKNQGKVWGELP